MSSSDITRCPVVGLLLAAGRSRRMGEPKQLLPLLDGTVLSILLATLLATELDDVRVVLAEKGRGVDKMREICAALGAHVITNPDPASEMTDSLRLGVRSLEGASAPTGVLIALCDQPLVGVTAVNHMLAAFRANPESIILPTWNNRRGHPVILPRTFLEELTPDATLRELVHAHSNRIHEVPVSTAAVLDRLDTPDDYHALCTRVRGG